MQKIFICILLCSISYCCKAQLILHQDTIHIRGIIYESSGKPASNIFIESVQPDPQNSNSFIHTKTDGNGYFELKGAKPQDTLTISDSAYRTNTRYMNKGSRYMAIYLPPPKIFDLSANNPIIIKASRKYPKLIPSFKVSAERTFACVLAPQQMAYFPGGASRFIDYLQKRLNYPEKAIQYNIEGMVEIAFSVERNGSLANFKILKGIGYDCEQGLIDILKRSPKWRPGTVAGRPVITQESVSVQFSLTDN